MSCIDWHKQWELHTPNFSDGLAHIPLQSKQGKIKKFSLLPGAGFGDLSHPTTKLMLEMMPQKIEGEMIDIGCGSAILSIAGALRGAKKVIGLEVDPSAILHAKENVKWNQLENSITIQTTLTSAHELQKPLLLLMNMISSEQKIVWGSLSFLHAMPKTLIVSGILEEEKKEFLQRISPSYGTLVRECLLEGWLGLIFEKTFPCR